MDKNAVIVINFPEPKESILLGMILTKAKSLFDEDREKVTLYMAVAETAEQIMKTLIAPKIEEEGNLVKHAKHELSLLHNDEEFNQSMIKAVEAFASYGHSGGSASYAIPLLNDLLQYKNLTPFTDDPKEWMHVDSYNDVNTWQNRRNSEAFSHDEGKTYYLLSEGVLSDGERIIHNSLKKEQ